MRYLALFVSLPTKATAGRMRVWRSAKAMGCAALRDGVYLLPDAPEHVDSLGEIISEATSAGGSAVLYRLGTYDDAQQQPQLQALFDRQTDYAKLIDEARDLNAELATIDHATAQRRMQAIWRRFEQTANIDFFAGESQRQTLDHLDSLREKINRLIAPDEPCSTNAAIQRLDIQSFQERTWATRARPWVDRLACAWLIRRYIDKSARFVWLAQTSDCQKDWLGFDFDGATFTHVGAKVTFETIMISFGLENDPGLSRLAELVHFLDAGGIPVVEAAGVEAMLAGLRATETDDDRLVEKAFQVFDWLIKNHSLQHQPSVQIED